MVFKQLLQADAIDVVQIDSCRLAGVSEVLAVLLMVSASVWLGIEEFGRMYWYEGSRWAAQVLAGFLPLMLAKSNDDF